MRRRPGRPRPPIVAVSPPPPLPRRRRRSGIRPVIPPAIPFPPCRHRPQITTAPRPPPTTPAPGGWPARSGPSTPPPDAIDATVTSRSVECRMLSRHDNRARTEYGSHFNCRTIQIVAWNYRRADVPALGAAPIGPPPSSSHDPDGGAQQGRQNDHFPRQGADCLRGLDASSPQQMFPTAEGAEGAAGTEGGGIIICYHRREKSGSAGGGSGSSGDNNECVGEYGETRLFHVGTLQRHYKKISDAWKWKRFPTKIVR